MENVKGEPARSAATKEPKVAHLESHVEHIQSVLAEVENRRVQCA